MTSYLSENEAKNLQNGDVHIAQIPDFEMEYLETILRLEVGDSSLFAFFTLFDVSLTFFRPEVPFKDAEKSSFKSKIWKPKICSFVIKKP